MKQAWTRLLGILKRHDDDKFLEARFENLFLRHHKNAHELVYKKDRKVLAAIYFSPVGLHQKETIAFLRAVRDQTMGMLGSEFEEELKDGS